MEYMPQYVEQPPETKGISLRKSNSVELRAGKLYPTCYCIKRNGLQNDCQRSECQEKTSRMNKSVSAIGSSNCALRLSNHHIGAGARRNATPPIQKVGELPSLAGSEILLTNGTDLSDLKEIDPKLLSQMYQPIPAQSYTQFSATPKMPTFDQNFHGMQMDQPIPNQVMSNSQPQIGNLPSFVDTSKTGTQMSGQNMFSMPQNFTNKMPSPIAAIEPMPSIQPLASSNGYSPAGMQMQQANQTQSSSISGQFVPYMAGLSPLNPYSPNVASYLPYSTANLTSMSTGIPCSPTQ